MPKASDRSRSETPRKPIPKRKVAKRVGERKRTEEQIARDLGRYHAVIEHYAKLNIPPFSAVEEQQELRRKELEK